MFGYLTVHSHYSLLRGIAKTSALLEKAKASGCDAIALTDTHNLYGAIEFYKKAKDMGIRPLLGVTLFVQQPNTTRLYPVVLLAEHEQGYRNILTLTTFARFNSDSATPSVSFEQLSSFSGGVIALLPALYNSVVVSLVQGDRAAAGDSLRAYQSIFGNNLYVGISPQDPTPRGSAPVENQTASIVSLARDLRVQVIPLPLIYLLDEEGIEARDVLLKIQKISLSHAEEDVFEDHLLFPDRADTESWCQSVCPEALENLSQLIERVDWELPLGEWVFPIPPVPEGSDRVAVLQSHVDKGYAYRGLERTKEIEERVAFELSVIVDRGYTDYFLSVIDLVNYMHENGILTTTRGSAAGSMVSYLAGITNVDPIEYQLPFERFLNPFRPSPPDIDLDIADNRRNEVLDYIIKQFGSDKVAQIGTLGTMMARAAVRDTARALGYSYLSGDRIARLIPLGAQGAPMYIDTALADVKDLKALYDSDETTKHIIDVAKKIEGNARHLSVHAAGVVISPTTITQYTPLERDPKGVSKRPITQYNMHAVEDAGLVKFDILGLTNLAILAGAVRLVKEDLAITIDVERLPLTDKKTYSMLGKGYTMGVFQMGGSGMTSVLRRMKPTSMYDLAAIIALYRPGPMHNIDDYIDRKLGNKSVVYAHPTMEKFLKNSYGVLVYQDDLLYTAIEIAGYNWEEVDVFRKAVGKKIPELMAEQEKVFKKRVKERTNMPDSQVNALWDLFDPFKGYGFNKAHAMSYAKVAYQTAYMKAHFPAQYMTAHLNAVEGETENIADLVYESKRLNLSVLAPGVNSSDVSFTTEEVEADRYAIRIGLATIKQVGRAVAEAIVSERNSGGAYSSLEDFFTRIASYRVANRRNIEALIKVGVFDEFNQRDTLLENIDLLLQSAKDAQDDPSQQLLFDAPPSITFSLVPSSTRISKAQELYWEKDLLGVYVSGHPLKLFKREGLHIKDIKRKEKDSRVLTTTVIGGLKPFRNRSGERMYFVTLEDDANQKIEAVCFPKEAVAYEELLALYRPVKVRGSTSMRNDEVSLRIDSIENPAPSGV